jgi:hypothetical protein
MPGPVVVAYRSNGKRQDQLSTPCRPAAGEVAAVALGHRPDDGKAETGAAVGRCRNGVVPLKLERPDDIIDEAGAGIADDELRRSTRDPGPESDRAARGRVADAVVHEVVDGLPHPDTVKRGRCLELPS